MTDSDAALTRLPEFRPTGVNEDPTSVRLFLTTRWAHQARAGSASGLRRFRQQLGLIKAAAIVGTHVEVVAPLEGLLRNGLNVDAKQPGLEPEHLALEAQTYWSSVGRARPDDAEAWRAADAEVRTLLGSPAVRRESAQQRWVIIAMHLRRAQLEDPEWEDDADDDFSAQEQEQFNFEMYMRIDRLLGCFSAVSVLDNAARRDLQLLVSITSDELRAEWFPDSRRGGLALSVAPLYALNAVPGIEALSADDVLEARSSLSDSLTAFRALVADISYETTGIGAADAKLLLSSRAARLDAAYSDVRKQASDAKLRKVLRARIPAYSAASATATLGFAISGGQPLVGLTGLLGVTVGQAVLALHDKISRTRSLRSHPMYWRYNLTSAPRRDT